MCDLQAYPYGNAKERRTNKGWEYTCQHGADECVGNMVEVCALNMIKDQLTRLQFLVCLETAAHMAPTSNGRDW